MKLPLAVLLGICSICLALTWTPTRPDDHVLKIMCVGDSITYGIGSPGGAAGYRAALAADYPYPIRFVGGWAYGTSQYANCEGYPGKTSYQIEPHIAPAMAEFRPDVVLLLCGLNDIAPSRGNESPRVAAAGIRKIVSEILALKPDCRVYIATLIPVYGHPQLTGSKWTALNRNIASIGLGMGPRVRLVVMSAARLEPSDLFDGVHPNQGGYKKMAKVWAAALKMWERRSPATR